MLHVKQLSFMGSGIYDLAIIGAGPAGSSAAIEAQKHGLKTLILEKEELPRYKICGGGFLLKANNPFDYDIETVVERIFHDIHIYVHDISFHHHVKRKAPILYTVMRDSFDHYLFSLIDGQKIYKYAGTELLDITKENNLFALHTSKGVVRSKYIIAADGAHSTTAKISGWKEDRNLAISLECEIPISENHPLCHELRFDIGFIPRGYAWVFPKKKLLSIGLGKFSSRKVKINLHDYLKRYFAFLNLKPAYDFQIQSSVIPISPRKEGLYKGNILLCGDAAGLADPVVAEGITFAMMSGKLAALAVSESLETGKKAGSLYQRSIDDKIIHHQKHARFLAHILYDMPYIANFVFRKRGTFLSEKFTDYYLSGHPYPDGVFSFLKSLLKLFKG
ncbi:MAG: geranylgeranyl reductase family protein [Bacteroidales bacterium]|nr:geranylgeranyl reductase family protein [Bacteroidales bacterium]